MLFSVASQILPYEQSRLLELIKTDNKVCALNLLSCILHIFLD